MYKIRKSNFEEFKKTCENSFEPGEPAYCEDFDFYKLVCDDGIVCEIGDKTCDEGDGLKTYLVGTFTYLSPKHVRALVEIGKWYIDAISSFPTEIIVERGNKRFERFAEFFGFKKTLAQEEQDGVQYNVYIRNPECLLQQ